MKKTPPKVGYFKKTAEMFSTALEAKSAQKQKGKKFIWVFTVLGIYNFAMYS